MSLPLLPPRPDDSHKGDYGRALLVGGAQGLAGAIALAGMAALRGGAGLVKLAVPEEVQSVVAGFEPSYMTLGLPCDAAGGISLEGLYVLSYFLQEATCMAIGPGLGQSAATTQFVAHLYRDVPTTMVVDADALNSLAKQPELLQKAGGPRILTPHPGEFARLIGKKSAEQEVRSGTLPFVRSTAAAAAPYAPEARRELAQEFAARTKAILVLKGHRTIVTDGQRVFENETGNPGMATGGAGDVLTGLITALVCQGLSPFDAARLGAHVHGLAGDLAAAELGQVSLIASDLIRFLPRALQSVHG